MLASPRGQDPFGGDIVFAVDAFPVFALQFSIGRQQLDAAYGRGLNTGRGVVGEGGDTGPGVVGSAGGVITNPAKPLARPLSEGPRLGRGIRAGVIGFGADPTTRGERRGTGAAIGVFGQADKSVGGFGFFTGNAGVYGAARTTGVIGDGNGGPIGVEGISGGHCGVYGHLNYKTPSGDDIGVFGAAAVDLGNPHDPIGRAGVFAGAVEFIGNLTVTGDSVV